MSKKLTSGLDASSQRVVNVATPTGPTDAATKGYVDGLIPSPVMFRVYRSADQGGLVPSTQTKITFNTETFDIGNGWASSTFTAPIAGKYLFYVALNFSVGVVDGSLLQASVYKNGASIAIGVARPGSANPMSVNCSTVADLAVGDTVEFYGLGGGTGNKTIDASSTLSYAYGLLI